MEIQGDWSVDHIAAAVRPEPTPGPTQILLRMKAATLNYRDHVMVHRGYGNRSGSLPLVPLSDGVGEVVATGLAVTRFKVGDRACPIFCQDWISGPFKDHHWPSQLGGPRDGVLQESIWWSRSGRPSKSQPISAILRRPPCLAPP